MEIKLLNKISPVIYNELDAEKYTFATESENPDAIMVRSAAMHDLTFPKSVKAIARCGAGVNNIPVDRCAEEGIVVFNTPGANANSVKELAIAAILLASRNIVGGISWSNTLAGNELGVAKAVEKGKGQFGGCEIQGKTLGVIGLGAIGGMVANAAIDLGMKVIGYDPFITVKAAWNLSRSITAAASYEEVFKKADYITLHVPATKDTKNMINADSLATMKDGVKIINLSRADLVCAADLKAAIEAGKVDCYVTDFPTEETINSDKIITIPHLGASTEEAEDNCAAMAARQLDDYLVNGNIVNSVNYPAVSMERTGVARICILHKNIPNMLASISSSLSAVGVNIENMANRSKGDYSYTIVDVNEAVPAEAIDKIAAVEGIARVFVV
ncbi:MAG: 3-phosphoglycerate dehydrogenase [Clostridia bacterium]|nr:3-phosphoglycerate dehydrogenase [Clostridia bacterium]